MRWERCIVAAPGPSLTEEVAQQCRGVPVIAVQDAYKRIPWADVLYGCDALWWEHHNGCADFAGEKWSSHDPDTNDKTEARDRYGVHLVEGRPGVGFSFDDWIHYGSNSGFQAINLAIHFGCTRILLCGFDMRSIDGRRHFFGGHPVELGRSDGDYERFIPTFETAAKLLPPHVEVINVTPGSALRCFPMGTLDGALTELSRGEGLRG